MVIVIDVTRNTCHYTYMHCAAEQNRRDEMNTIHSRAPKGGALGANGEWYKGGKFINTVPKNAKGLAKSKKPTRKQEVEPYVWAVPPQDGQVSIFRQFAGVFGGLKNGVAFVECKQVTLDWYKTTREEVQSMVDAYNRGERWMNARN